MSDQGGEIENSKFITLYDDQGISHDISSIRHPKKSDVEKRKLNSIGFLNFLSKNHSCSWVLVLVTVQPKLIIEGINSFEVSVKNSPRSMVVKGQPIV